MGRTVEVILVLIVISIATCMGMWVDNAWVMLHLFYLPVILGGLLLERLRAWQLALLSLLSAIVASQVAFLNSPETGTTMLFSMLTFTIWASVLSITASLVGVVSDEKKRNFFELRKTLTEEATIDPLTGAFNKRYVEQELERWILEAEDAEDTFGILLLDIDFFKRINDRYGHDVGDEILKETVAQVRTELRQEDFVARIGGEEFLVALAKADKETTQQVAERIRRHVANARYAMNGLRLKVTVSLGAANIIMPGDKVNAILKRVDTALYAAKEAGRNQTFYHTSTGLISISNDKAGLDPGESAEQTGSQGITSILDEVTGLPKFPVFEEELSRRVHEFRRYGTALTVLLVEFEFKGNDETDEASFPLNQLTAQVVQRIRSSVRECDFAAIHSSNRVVVQCPSTRYQSVKVATARILSIVDELDATSPFKLSVGVSVTQVSADDTCEHVLNRLNTAMEAGRTIGPNIAMVHDGDQVQQFGNEAQPVAIAPDVIAPADTGILNPAH